MSGLREWRVDLPWTTPPLTLNPRQHGHYMVRARKVREVRAVSRALVRAAGVPPLRRVALELHYRPRDRRRRDAVNLVATLKALEDGAVDAGVVPDDTAEFSEPTMPLLDPVEPGKPGSLYLVVRELEPPG